MRVVDAKAAAKVEVLQSKALAVDLSDEVAHDARSVAEGCHVLDGAAKVAVRAHELHERLRLDGLQEPFEVRVADAKLA